MNTAKLIALDKLSFEQNLASGTAPVKAFRDALQAANKRLKEYFLAGEDIAQLVQLRTHFVDELLCKAWRYHAKSFHNTQNLALIAVGGYGRGELHPGSDIDLLILLPDSYAQPYREFIEQFLAFLWDIGLDVGHSTRSAAECASAAEQDITIATNLIEARLLEGPATMFAALREAISTDHIWPSRPFFEAKWQEQIARHHKYHDTEYNLEPNVKEGPGGLRDIHVIAWVAKRHFGAKTLHDLVTRHFLTENEYNTLMHGQTFLWKVRFGLHSLTGRREDRLLFDYQRTLAKQFGYEDQEHRLAVEHFMKDYYCAIMELSRLNEMLLQLFQEAILYADNPSEVTVLNKRFQIRKGFIEIRHPNIFSRYPFALLEIFLLLQQHPEFKGVRAATIRAIRDHRHLIDDTFRADLRNRSLFMEILRQPAGITHELRRMNRYGLLAAYLPAFGKIVGLMQYDLFHVYTVDEHILRVVRNLRRFTVAQYKHELPLCSEIIERIPKLEILYLAGLFHDMAKGRGGDHSSLGAQEAVDFCLLHGMSSYDARFVGWLVKQHLIMSSTAQRQDISDPTIISTFAIQVGDQVHLDYLYLLTVADIRGTSQSLWNSWKDALLKELYSSTKRALRRGLENPIDKADRILELQSQARELLNQGKAINASAIDNVWRSVNDDYFLRHSADEIAWHTQAIAGCQPADLPIVLVREETLRGGTEIFIYMADQERIFATITQALDQLGLTIFDARIITSHSGFALDTFIVLEESGEPIASAYRIDEIVTKLRHDLTHMEAMKFQSTRRQHRRLKHFTMPTEIAFSTDIPNQRTVMELITVDRPGLLSRVGRALVECGVGVQNAKIATFGARVEDIFFLVGKNNQALQDEAQFICLRERISQYLDGQAS